MSQTKEKKEKKYIASILFSVSGVLSGGISALSPQIKNPAISQLQMLLSNAYIWLFGFAAVSFLLEYSWRHWLRSKWDNKKKSFKDWFREEIKNAVKAELESYRSILEEFKQNTQNLYHTTDEQVITDTVKKKITGPIRSDLEDQTRKIIDIFNDLVASPVKKSVEISQELCIALKEENFKFLQTDAIPLENFIQRHHNITKIRIICYGRNGYNKVFHYIEEHQKKIDCDIIVCDSQCNESISAPGDNEAISNQIAKIRSKRRNSGIRNIYKTKIIPSIRAVVLYAGEQAIWASYEPYIFSLEDGKNVLRRAGSITTREPGSKSGAETDAYNGTLIVELDKENTIKKDEFNKIVERIEKEFDRLKAESDQVKSSKARSKGADK